MKEMEILSVEERRLYRSPFGEEFPKEKKRIALNARQQEIVEEIWQEFAGENHQCEQCGTGADHYIQFFVFRPLKLIVPLACRHFGIQNRYPLSKTLVKTHHGLISQGNLRNQHNGLSACFHHPFNQFYVNGCLTASRHSVKQPGMVVFPGKFLPDLFHNFLLFCIQRNPLFFLWELFAKGTPVQAPFFYAQNLHLFHGFHHRSGDVQLIRPWCVFTSVLANGYLF